MQGSPPVTVQTVAPGACQRGHGIHLVNMTPKASQKADALAC